jgi:outer membrane protein assembly factor BamB
LAFLLSLPLSAFAENWPAWRGPRGDGTSLETEIPIRWNAKSGENLLWKLDVPGVGHASPIVWGNRIFVVSCLEQTHDRVLICIDRQQGSVLWQQVVLRAPLETKHNLNSYASSTPATDGELVYVTFLEVDGRTVPAPNVSQPRPVTVGRIAVAAYDFDGQRRWLVHPGAFISAHGFCSSPVLYEDLVIVNGDHDGESYIVALDRKTGATVWQTPRPHKTRSYVTPIIREIAGQTQMVLCGSMCVTSYDPSTGSLLWSLEGPTEQFVASMVCDGSLFFLAAGYPTYHVMAIRPDGSGDITKSHVAWHTTNAACYVPSPVVANGHLVVADDRGTVNCFEASTGRRLWRERIGNHFSASPITAAGLVYLSADNGTTTVTRPGNKLDVVSKNELGEFTHASPAVSNGRIYIRGEKHLFCIGAKQREGGE